MRIKGFILLLTYLLCSCTAKVPEICQYKWQFVKVISDDNTLALSSPAADVVINFALDGSMSGYAGCNSFFGEYSLPSGNQIRPIVSGTTMSMCEYQDFEDIYLSLLGDCKSYTIKGQELRLKNTATGNTLLYKIK